jgi:hypothetical protein
MKLVRIDSGDNGPVWINAESIIAIENMRNVVKNESTKKPEYCNVYIGLGSERLGSVG